MFKNLNVKSQAAARQSQAVRGKHAVTFQTRSWEDSGSRGFSKQLCSLQGGWDLTRGRGLRGGAVTTALKARPAAPPERG